MYQIGKLVWREWNGCQEFWSWGIDYITCITFNLLYVELSACQHHFLSLTYTILHPFPHQNYTPYFKVTLFLAKMYPQSGKGKTGIDSIVVSVFVNVGWVGQISEAKIQKKLWDEVPCLPRQAANLVAQEKREDGQSSSGLQSDWHWQQWLPRQRGVPQVYQVE